MNETWVQLAALAVFAYLLGSIPNGLIIGKLFYHKDIRQFGSGNIGTTNTFRVLGKKAGIMVFTLDVLKGAIPTAIAGALHTPINPLFIGIFAALGHAFSIYLHFTGGKIVATSAGILLGYHPILFFVGATIFLITLYLTSMVSVGSLTVLTVMTITALGLQDWTLGIIGILITSLSFYLHRSNIKRILNHNENMVKFGLGYQRRLRKHS